MFGEEVVLLSNKSTRKHRVKQEQERFIFCRPCCAFGRLT